MDGGTLTDPGPKWDRTFHVRYEVVHPRLLHYLHNFPVKEIAFDAIGKTDGFARYAVSIKGLGGVGEIQIERLEDSTTRLMFFPPTMPHAPWPSLEEVAAHNDRYPVRGTTILESDNERYLIESESERTERHEAWRKLVAKVDAEHDDIRGRLYKWHSLVFEPLQHAMETDPLLQKRPQQAEQENPTRPVRRRGGPIPTPDKDKIMIIERWFDVEGRMDQDTYCATKGISSSTLRRWIRQLRQQRRLPPS